MEKHQDDSPTESNTQENELNLIEVPKSSPQDTRKTFAENLPLDSFFENGRQKIFASLGRITEMPAKTDLWQMTPARRKEIQEEARNGGSGIQSPELFSADLLALAAEGTKLSAEKLDESNRFWWKSRENSMIWQKTDSKGKVSFLKKWQKSRSEKLANEIRESLGLNEDEGAELLKIEDFSRQTVYTRDYAAIPKQLKALFKMVPTLIFAPRKSEQLCEFMSFAAQKNIKIAARGRGTWALGGALLTKGGVVLEMASFEKRIDVEAQKCQITVSASVDFQEAEEALNKHGLTLHARPSNKYGVISGFLSVGEPMKGGLGLNAFGSGHISDFVESIRVITADGKQCLITKEHSDFSYYLGTNGRYGIITEVTLRAVPRSDKHHSSALQFVNSKKAFQFLHSFLADLESAKPKCGPLHIEFFGKPYLDELNKIKLTESATGKKLIQVDQIKRSTPAKDTVLFVFHDELSAEHFCDYVTQKDGEFLPQAEADKMWEERFSPMKLRKKGDLLTAEVIVPIKQVDGYLKEVTELANKLGIKILPVAYILNSNEALVLPQFLTDRRLRFQYYRHFSLLPVFAHRAVCRFKGRPYGFGLWFAGMARLALGSDVIRRLHEAKKRLDPFGILNPGKLTEIRSRFANIFGNVLLHEKSIAALEFALTIQTHLRKIPFFRKTLLSTKEKPYQREQGDALHRCIKCSACMICPLAQIWERSGDPKLMSDAIFITPRFKMEYMQRYLYEGEKLSQEDVDRFVLCFRCGVAERETICPISDMLLEVDENDTTPCQKKLPTYDEFEDRLRKDGYDVDGAIARYMDVLKTHPGVARAMQEVLGQQRVQKSGEFSVLQPKTDFAIYKVDVDQNRCINCGKCGDEHTTSQRGFWDPRNPRKMVSLDDLLAELAGKIPKDWFSDKGGPIPASLKLQCRSNGKAVYFEKRSKLDGGHQHCNGCLYCVIECPVDAIRVGINDYYENLAGQDFSREDVRRINEESRTGGVPTSGTGSTGLFGGKGFDRYMFDFSVIVRPTRDGIREAIDIGVNLGRKPLFHLFEKGTDAQFPKIRTTFNTLDLATPILLELPDLKNRNNKDLVRVFADGANREDTVVFMGLQQFTENFNSIQQFSKNIALRLHPDQISRLQEWLQNTDPEIQQKAKEIRLVELVHVGANAKKNPENEIRKLFGQETIISKLVLCENDGDPKKIATQVVELAEAGAEAINLKTAFNMEKGFYESVDILPVCYEQLLANSLHTQVSLLSNGIKSPADMGISLMLGASAVVLDRTPLVALNHEFPMLEKIAANLPEIEWKEGTRRLQNLFQSWHKQIREVLGAFGVRDLRRTVGESGRLIDLRDRERLMRAIVEDKSLRQKAVEINQQKIDEDGKLARAASWKYSDISRLIKSVPPPNENLLGGRKTSLESMIEARGDRRWNADMLTATWMMASGDIPSHKVPQSGADFGGGSFDLMKFAPVRFNGKLISVENAVEQIDKKVTSGDAAMFKALDAMSISSGVINKHRRPGTEPYVNHFPIDAADMSLGSIGWKLTLARYLAGAALKRFTGTGEGGYPLEKYDRLEKFFPALSKKEITLLGSELEKWVATQAATGYFGVTEDTIRRARKVVLKFAQGAKPGLGGHILGAKVTSQVEDLRGVIAGISVFSPFPFHDVYSIEDVTKMIEWLRTINPDAIITVKISTPVDVYHVALGLVTGGVDEIQIDATAGGTGAAPDIARNRIAMPLEYGLSDVHKFLVEQGERNKVTLVASGGIRSAYDMAKAIILGADKVILGTQEIVAEQCNRCGNCEAPGGCQKGITTTVEQLEAQKEILLNAQWLINSQTAIVQHLIKMMYAWGVRDIRELRGRTDLIESWGWNHERPQVSAVTETKANERVSKNGKRSASNGRIKAKALKAWDSAKEERKELDACGVVSFACTQAVSVESIQTACQRMHNRGNGRGGGILGLGGMFAKEFAECYALQVIVLAPEKTRIKKILKITKEYLREFDIFDRFGQQLSSEGLTKANIHAFRNPRKQCNGQDISWAEAGLSVDPGDMFRFFVRAKKKSLLKFAQEILEKCRVKADDKHLLENGNPGNFLKKMNIAGKWVEYYVKYYDVLTAEYLEKINPDSDFWLESEYADLWRDLEDEFVYRRAFEINQHYYIDPETPEAFVSSMMKNGGIWKLVGYAEQNADYWIIGDAQYVPVASLKSHLLGSFKGKADRISQLAKIITEFRRHGKIEKGKRLPENFFTWRNEKSQLEIRLNLESEKVTLIIPAKAPNCVVIHKHGAHIWIGHQRFPTVFSPYGGGSHPFYGRVHEALIHNGDFANYVAMVRFWDQFGGAPQFRTDTEMAAKAYAILKQMGYPQSYIFEAIAPTTGVDLQRLKAVNAQLAGDFEAIQKTQIAGSPDGPWFFIIADQNPVSRDLKIIGLTDPSVLRPSVFLWQQNSNEKYASIGLVGSEEQACRTVLEALCERGILASSEPDCAKIVRGGSVEQEAAGEIAGGGAIVYDLKKAPSGNYLLRISDKFGNTYQQDHNRHYDLRTPLQFDTKQVEAVAQQIFSSDGVFNFSSSVEVFRFVSTSLKEWHYNTFRWFVEALGNAAKSDEQLSLVINALNQIKDQLHGLQLGNSNQAPKRASLSQIVADELNAIFDDIPLIGRNPEKGRFVRVILSERQNIDNSTNPERCLVVDASGFPPEGHQSLARTLIGAYEKGWRKFIVYRITGQRYLGAGFGPDSHDLELHLYGSPGQDIANSMMGGTVHVHANAQNDMAKILHSGTVVVHGLAGNTGIYGAKGGEIFVRGSVGARWVINSVSSPAGPGLKVLIVGSAMEYLAESLMGGMVVMLGLDWDETGILRRKYLPFAGNSILAGASAGKVVVYDPDNRLTSQQFKDALDVGFLASDWVAVYKNFQRLVMKNFSEEAWSGSMERWRSLSKYAFAAQGLSSLEKEEVINNLVDVLKGIFASQNHKKKLEYEARTLRRLVETGFTGKEWRTLVRQLGQILGSGNWANGMALLERMMDWNEVVDLLVKADRHFNLRLTLENGWVYLPINGQKTEIRRSDFKVLRPLTPAEQQKEKEKKESVQRAKI